MFKLFSRKKDPNSKAYRWEMAKQMANHHIRYVTEKINGIPYFITESKSFAEYVNEGLICYIDQQLWETYYQTVLNEAIAPEIIRNAGLNIVYTPLCGTGNEPVREVLSRLGVNIRLQGKSLPSLCPEDPDSQQHHKHHIDRCNYDAGRLAHHHESIQTRPGHGKKSKDAGHTDSRNDEYFRKQKQKSQNDQSNQKSHI